MEKILYLKMSFQTQTLLVGKLINHDGLNYSFEYSEEAKQDFQNTQFKPIPKEGAKWTGNLGPFQDRVLSPQRKGASKVLRMMGMETFDPWVYLEKSQGRSQTDTYFLTPEI